ncbi:UDP-glucose 4-epimerase GalE [Candidatus Babeliales bacterium]|nr:UDP-glucose 4-epimerase GalE [Candidatus Babeliales bacterium]
MKKSILLTGGAGYIGSHTAYFLAQQGYHVVIVDSYVQHQTFDPSWATVVRADFSDQKTLVNIFKTYAIEAVMHFAAFIEVGESVTRPADFYENNVGNVFKLLRLMLEHDIKKIVFSSSCAVYGNPVRMPMDELHPTMPVSPYGRNKLMVEWALQDYAAAYDLRYVSLRYFNAAGALPDVHLGEHHQPETHLIPRLLQAIQNNEPVTVFGNDYNTPDGTCLRDYIHVADIAQAHVLALKYLRSGAQSEVFNLGTGLGYTVKQVIDAAEVLCNKKANIQVLDRRPGDAEVLLADPTKIKNVLGWQPHYSDLLTILSSALAWETMRTLSASTTQQVHEQCGVV